MSNYFLVFRIRGSHDRGLSNYGRTMVDDVPSQNDPSRSHSHSFRFLLPTLDFFEAEQFSIAGWSRFGPGKFWNFIWIELCYFQIHIYYFICCIFRSSKGAQSWRSSIWIRMRWMRHLSRQTWNCSSLLLPNFAIFGNFRIFFLLVCLGK